MAVVAMKEKQEENPEDAPDESAGENRFITSEDNLLQHCAAFLPSDTVRNVHIKSCEGSARAAQQAERLKPGVEVVDPLQQGEYDLRLRHHHQLRHDRRIPSCWTILRAFATSGDEIDEIHGCPFSMLGTPAITGILKIGNFWVWRSYEIRWAMYS